MGTRRAKDYPESEVRLKLADNLVYVKSVHHVSKEPYR